MSEQRPTPETDDAEDRYGNGNAMHTRCHDLSHLSYDFADFARKLERERDEAREQIALSVINTNVRLFDLVRYSRASLHEDELITDEEYAWLCGGCEMANSPKGGSPSPKRLEDYDDLRKQLEAMREAIKEAHESLVIANDLLQRAGREDGTTWEPGQSWIFWEDKCSAKNDVESIRAALTKLQPFLKP